MPTASLASTIEPATPDDRDRQIAAGDLAVCRAMLANGSRTFLAASWLLPRSVRSPAV